MLEKMFSFLLPANNTYYLIHSINNDVMVEKTIYKIDPSKKNTYLVKSGTTP